jgi:hypothetical protein
MNCLGEIIVDPPYPPFNRSKVGRENAHLIVGEIWCDALCKHDELRGTGCDVTEKLPPDVIVAQIGADSLEMTVR